MERKIKANTNEKYTFFDDKYDNEIEDVISSELNTENIVFKLVNEYFPPCIIIDQKGKLIYISGDSGKYLKIQCGKASLDIFKMVPENILYSIKNAISRIKVEKSAVTYSNIVFELGNQIKIIDLKIKPFFINENEQYFIIFFVENEQVFSNYKIQNELNWYEEVKTHENKFDCLDYKDHNYNIVKAVDHGLKEEKTEHNIEYSENNQPQTKNSDDFISETNNYCVGSIFLDRHLCIRRYTIGVKKEIHLLEHDMGRPINYISHNFKNENLAQNSIRVLNSLVSKESEVQSTNGNWYVLRYSPHIEFDNALNGIIITLIDVTLQKKTFGENNFLSHAVEQSSSMIMITNVDGKVEYVNPKFTEITGYTRDEIIGRDFGILKSGLQDAEFYKNLRATINQGKEWKGELCNKKKNGEIYWELASISPVKNEDGSITHFIEIKEDITNRKMEIDALKSSEEKFQQIFNNIKDLIFLYEVNIKGAPGKLIDVNNVACEILGYTKEELQTMNMYDIIDEENIIDIHKINQNLLTQGHSTFDVNYLCKNGYRLSSKVSCNVISSNGEKLVLLIARDITEQKKNEEVLLKSKERYEFLVEYSPYSILIVSSGIILFSNIAGLNMFEVNEVDELVGKPIKKFFNIDIQKLINEQNVCSDVDGKQAIPLEDKITKPDGTCIFVEITAMPFFFDGKTATLMMIRDITSRKQAEELQKDIEKSKKLLDETIAYDTLKTEFFSNISHELRTPLNGLISTLQLLNMHLKGNTIFDRNKKMTKYTDIMKQNSYRLLRIVNNMIDITRIDTGFFEFNPYNCDIVNVVEEITMSVAEYIGNKKVTVIFDTDVEEKNIYCDPDKIERIMLNLLSNAVKFTKTGGCITVNMYDKKDMLLISVRDTGIGIPEDKLGIIFERFRQVDKSLTRNHEGSGIGLSLVKSLVEMHKGNINVRSEPGKGSEFLIGFPITVHQEEDSTSKPLDVESRDNFEKVSIEFSDIYN